MILSIRTMSQLKKNSQRMISHIRRAILTRSIDPRKYIHTTSIIS